MPHLLFLQLFTIAALAIYYHSIDDFKVIYNHLIAKSQPVFRPSPCWQRISTASQKGSYHLSLDLKPTLDSSILFWLYTYLPEVHCAVETAHILTSKCLSSQSLFPSSGSQIRPQTSLIWGSNEIAYIENLAKYLHIVDVQKMSISFLLSLYPQASLAWMWMSHRFYLI